MYWILNMLIHQLRSSNLILSSFVKFDKILNSTSYHWMKEREKWSKLKKPQLARHQKLKRSRTQSMTGPLNHNGAKDLFEIIKFNKFRNEQTKENLKEREKCHEPIEKWKQNELQGENYVRISKHGRKSVTAIQSFNHQIWTRGIWFE